MVSRTETVDFSSRRSPANQIIDQKQNSSNNETETNSKHVSLPVPLQPTSSSLSDLEIFLPQSLTSLFSSPFLASPTSTLPSFPTLTNTSHHAPDSPAVTHGQTVSSPATCVTNASAATLSALPDGDPSSRRRESDNSKPDEDHTRHFPSLVSTSPQESPTVSTSPRESAAVTTSPREIPAVSTSPRVSAAVSTSHRESPAVSTSPRSPAVSNLIENAEKCPDLTESDGNNVTFPVPHLRIAADTSTSAFASLSPFLPSITATHCSVTPLTNTKSFMSPFSSNEGYFASPSAVSSSLFPHIPVTTQPFSSAYSTVPVTPTLTALQPFTSSLAVTQNPFMGPLASPFLPHSVYLPHAIPPPLMESIMSLTSSWQLLTAYSRLHSVDTPSLGLPLPTPTFPELTPQEQAASSLANTEQVGFVPPDIVKKEIPDSSIFPFPPSLVAPPEGSERTLLGWEDAISFKSPVTMKKDDNDEGASATPHYRVKWGEHASRLCSHVASLLEGEIVAEPGADMHLMGACDGPALPAHKLVMAAASPLIRRLLEAAPHSPSSLVVVPGASATALGALLSLCYTGVARVGGDMVEQVLQLAEELQIINLQMEPFQKKGESFSSMSHQHRNQVTPTITTSSSDCGTHQPIDYRVNQTPTTTSITSTQSPPSQASSKPFIPLFPNASSPSSPLLRSSPPSVFTFTPPPLGHSSLMYGSAVAPSPQIPTTRGDKRRPLTPDLVVSEPRLKKVRTEATFLPGPANGGASPGRGRAFGSGTSSSCSLPSSPYHSYSQITPPTPLEGGLLPTMRSGSLTGSSGSRVLLWKFLLHLLHDPRFCPVYIRWLDRSNGVFRIMESDMVAQLWGIARKNSNMNYEKMSRGMRTYYKRGILYHIDGTKLIYKFNTSDTEVQHHLRYFDIAQQALDSDTDAPSSASACAKVSSARTAEASAGIAQALSGTTIQQSISIPKSEQSFKAGDSLSRFQGTRSMDVTQGNKKGSEQMTLQQIGFTVPQTLPTLSLMPSFPGMSKIPSYSAPPSSHATHAIETGDLVSLPSQSSLDATPSLSNTRKSPSGASIFKKIDLLGLNKPRSNSIPNFQMSSRFASFFANSANTTASATVANAASGNASDKEYNWDSKLLNSFNNRSKKKEEQLTADLSSVSKP